MPVHIFVGHVRRVEPDRFLAELTRVREVLLVTRDTARVLVGEDILVAREDLVAVPAAKVVAVPILAQRLRVLPGKDELVAGAAPRLQVFCVVSLTVDFVVEYAVREINLQEHRMGWNWHE